jgi:prevent-host-death family protein
MRFTRDIQPLSAFRANAAAFVQQVRETRRPLVLTQHGRSAAVLLGVEEYERLVERAELLEDIAAAEQEMERGDVIEHETAKAQLLERFAGWRRSPRA